MTEVKFSIYRYLAPADYNLTYNECIQRFARGEAAVLSRVTADHS